MAEPLLWCLLGVLLLWTALTIYPGEFSWVSRSANRWLYDRGAKTYESKWQRHDYTQYARLIAKSVMQLAPSGQRPMRVLDVACGTGRATLFATRHLPSGSQCVAVDYSPGMLDVFRAHLTQAEHASALDDELELQLVEADVSSYLLTCEGSFDLILLMEAGEFIPEFRALPALLARVSVPGARLVMTRPAGVWGYFFPGRAQTRRVMKRCLHEAGFDEVQFLPWRARYELVSARRTYR